MCMYLCYIHLRLSRGDTIINKDPSIFLLFLAVLREASDSLVGRDASSGGSVILTPRGYV